MQVLQERLNCLEWSISRFMLRVIFGIRRMRVFDDHWKGFLLIKNTHHYLTLSWIILGCNADRYQSFRELVDVISECNRHLFAVAHAKLTFYAPLQIWVYHAHCGGAISMCICICLSVCLSSAFTLRATESSYWIWQVCAIEWVDFHTTLQSCTSPVKEIMDI